MNSVHGILIFTGLVAVVVGALFFRQGSEPKPHRSGENQEEKETAKLLNELNLTRTEIEQLADELVSIAETAVSRIDEKTSQVQSMLSAAKGRGEDTVPQAVEEQRTRGDGHGRTGLKRRVYQMIDEGEDVMNIARELDMTRDEITLALGLRRLRADRRSE